MLSYRHAYHAGNFADVLKHIIQVEILTHLVQKDKPFDYIDTHAGTGLYKLQLLPTQKNTPKNLEYKQGIARLISASSTQQWDEISHYLNIITDYNPDAEDGELQYYAGSPAFAEHFLRKKDRAWLFELHPNDYKQLAARYEHHRSIRVQQSDGYKGLLSLLPPISRRGLVMIDPSYEVKQDYQQVVDTLRQAHQRFATGIYALWYPVVERARIKKLENALINSGIRRIQLFELGIQADDRHAGMTAAGMIVINPPWRLREKLQPLLPKLAKQLTQDGRLHYRNVILVDE
ncbi:MAG: 23S rRNA (adenine(2030)-N(6))-methyltransferase RlmJ [bacterium]